GVAFNLADLFEIVVDAVPDRLALVAGEGRLTYRQLDERANRVAHHLLDHGIEPGDWVGIDAWNRAEWLEVMLGCFKARAVPINVNYRYVRDELRHILDNADAVALVLEPDFVPVVDSLRDELPQLRHVLVIGDEYEAALAAARADRDFRPRSSDDLYVLYPGGTTGMPKGVLWRQEDIFFAALGGGAILSAAVKEQLRKHLPDVLIVDSFGASETGAGGSVLQGDRPRFQMGEFMTVLDDDLQRLTPGSGTVGRLARRGHIPLGYHKDKAKTAATFVVAADGTRWVVPGDFATVEGDGTITLLGRGSQCINTGGEKVFPEEVEAVLKAHPDVFDAVVVGVPDERFVERVAAVVRPRDGRAS